MEKSFDVKSGNMCLGIMDQLGSRGAVKITWAESPSQDDIGEAIPMVEDWIREITGRNPQLEKIFVGSQEQADDTSRSYLEAPPEQRVAISPHGCVNPACQEVALAVINGRESILVGYGAGRDQKAVVVQLDGMKAISAAALLLGCLLRNRANEECDEVHPDFWKMVMAARDQYSKPPEGSK